MSLFGSHSPCPPCVNLPMTRCHLTCQFGFCRHLISTCFTYVPAAKLVRFYTARGAATVQTSRAQRGLRLTSSGKNSRLVSNKTQRTQVHIITPYVTILPWFARTTAKRAKIAVEGKLRRGWAISGPQNIAKPMRLLESAQQNAPYPTRGARI